MRIKIANYTDVFHKYRGIMAECSTLAKRPVLGIGVPNTNYKVMWVHLA